MQLFAASIALVLAITVVAADQAPRARATTAHTQCYTVTGLGSQQEMVSNVVPAFQKGAQAFFKGKNLRDKLRKCPNASQEVLNSSDDANFEIDSGPGICGMYNTDTQPGACLFSGTDQTGTNPTYGGWLSGSQPANCGRRIVAWMEGQAPVEMPIVDGCTFYTPTDAKASCSDIAFTVVSFLDVAGSEQATAVSDGHLANVHWKWVDQPL